MRRIIAVPIGKAPDDVTSQVKIPHFGKFLGLVNDASCLTSYFVQGLESPHVIIDQAVFWDKADNRRVMFTCVTRASETVTFLSTHDTLEKWCKNAYPDRKSILWYYFQQISDEHLLYLRRMHTLRRRELRTEIRQHGYINGLTRESFEIVREPTSANLQIPPSNKAITIALQEADCYDADAMLRRQEELRAKAMRKVLRAKLRKKKLLAKGLGEIKS
jgi:hypothetical protein